MGAIMDQLILTESRKRFKKKVGPVPLWEQVQSPRRCDCSAFKATRATEIILAEDSHWERVRMEHPLKCCFLPEAALWPDELQICKDLLSLFFVKLWSFGVLFLSCFSHKTI